jgi:aldehyde dehydrogenase (NAD+)
MTAATGSTPTTLPDTEALATEVAKALTAVGVDLAAHAGERPVRTPVTGGVVARLAWQDAAAVDAAVAQAKQAQRTWRSTPAPVRGALVKRLGQLVAEHTDELATLVQVEVGKTRTEAVGEIVEIVDVCDFAVGLSRQLYGHTMPSERPEHRIVETWQPLGVVGVITAFNFPAAVWGWNTALALVCGDTVVWKPSETTPLIALACQALLERAARDCGAPAHLGAVVLGDREVGQQLVDSPDVPLISATGSVRMGQQVAERVARRFGRALLELGGNNAGIVAPSADLDLAVPASVFAAAGTAGQRCTTMRRAIVHRSLVDDFCARVAAAFDRLPVGSPFTEQTVVGPLIGAPSWEAMQVALAQAQADGGTVLAGGVRQLAEQAPDAYYVTPALVAMPSQTAVVHEETFAPILYVVAYDDLEEAIAFNNEVPQGLSSCIFTRDVGEAETFLSAAGSDCGIVNVNIGTSGAEIGGAFGGEKQTGGGRESGSDAWQTYMRRSTATINASGRLALAQGVTFAL